MKKLVSVFLGFVAALMCASAQAGFADGITIDYVGANPVPGFASTGGSGQFTLGPGLDTGQVTKTFTSLGNVPIILRSTGFCFGGAQPGCTFSIQETVTNNTGVDWIGFHMGIGSIDPSVTASFGGDVDLGAGGFDSFEVGTDTLSLFGLVRHGEAFGVTFGLLASGPSNGLGGQFGIIETPSVPEPSVPEPATLALVGLALAGLGYSRRRKGR